ncbi:unnamed protein product [Mytilus coruscus]|uniref:Uncharacterized protein n=1 Tax=Mytilus coruscus TaxID=42192 RepID=A0A6J8EGD7_MYTCO|nr:unnamed protein product [Mytilus coruscus]
MGSDIVGNNTQKRTLTKCKEEDIEQEKLDTDEYKFNLETKIRKIRPLKRTSSINKAHFRAKNLGEKEETHNTEDKTERNTINIEHISRIMDTSRTKQRTTGSLKVNETDKSDLMWTRDTNQNKYFYDDLQGMRISKSPFKQLTLYQELDYREKLTRKKESEINVTPYYKKLW